MEHWNFPLFVSFSQGHPRLIILAAHDLRGRETFFASQGSTAVSLS